MKRFYFTFGTSDQFPYQSTYLVVVAPDYNEAVKTFRSKYPDKHEGCLNCSDYYDEKAWEETKVYYADRNPAEILYADCYGKKPDGFDDVYIFVPEVRQIIRIAEGTGDNLLAEDIEEGYKDYLYYEQYRLEQDMPDEDGGQILLEELVRDTYTCLADAIPDVLDFIFNYGIEDSAAKKIVTARILA